VSEPTAVTGTGRAQVSVSSVIDQASWLSEDVLLLAGRLPAEETWSVSLRGKGKSARLEAFSFGYGSRAYPGDAEEARTLVVAFLPPGRTLERERNEGALVIEVGEVKIEIESRELKALLTDLKTLARTTLAPLDAG
jgi:hypothetical protein